MRFNDLVGISHRPSQPQAAQRAPIDGGDGPRPTLSDDIANNGFVTGIVEPRRASRLRATRRTFLRSSIAAAAAGTAVSFGNLFGPARTVAAQTGVVGTYPRRILTFCPPYNSNDNCQPGCGSSPICTDCCGSDGFFRNDPANGYSLYAGGCGDGDIADGWLWRFNGVCGSCSAIEYRCSDGYVQTDTGPAPFICRHVTACEPLPEGTAGSSPPDAAVDTNWRPAGRLELATDNGGSVSLTGWIADATGQPIDMRILADNRIVHFGKAALPRPDVAGSVRGAGANTGYAVSFPIDPGTYTFCVNALKGALSVTIGCVTLTVGSGQSIRGDGGSATIQGATPPAPEPTATPDPSTAEPTATPAPTPTPTPAVDVVAAVPGNGPETDHRSHGSVQVIRRSGETTGFVSGWAGDPDSDDPVFVDVLADDTVVATTRPELPRPDVMATFPAVGPTTGFATSFELPSSQTTVCVEAVDPLDGRRWSLGCRTIGAAIDPDQDDAAANAGGPPTVEGGQRATEDIVWGRVDSAIAENGQVVVRGWALAPNDPSATVTLVAEATGVRQDGTTGLAHPEAERTYGIDHPCGYELTLALPAGEHTVTVRAQTATGTTTLGEQTVFVP